MKKYNLEYNGDEFTLTYFFNTDKNGGSEGIDVNKKCNKEHVGEIYGVSLPDEDDEDFDKELFEKRITNWLDDNYYS